MLESRLIKGISILLLAVFCSSCVTAYRDFPKANLDRSAASKDQRVLHYKINKFPVLDVGGHDALEKAFRETQAFSRTMKVHEPPSRGLYCLVEVEYKTPSLPALIFGYISVSTLAFLPAYSGQDGYRVKYHVYSDARPVKTYEYEITRKFGLWIALLPFIWVNLITSSERDAFMATTAQFFADFQSDKA